MDTTTIATTPAATSSETSYVRLAEQCGNRNQIVQLNSTSSTTANQQHQPHEPASYRIKRARISPSRELSPDAVELEHQRLSSASPRSVEDSCGASNVESDWPTLPSPVQSQCQHDHHHHHHHRHHHHHTSMSIASLINREENERVDNILDSINACSDSESSQLDEQNEPPQLPHGWTCSKPLCEVDPPTYATTMTRQPSSSSASASASASSQYSYDTINPTSSVNSHHPMSSNNMSATVTTRDLIEHMLMVSRSVSPGFKATIPAHMGMSAPVAPPSDTAAITTTMTTVTCWHAAVAQKSYGNEKRFLCPPPVVRVLRHPVHKSQQSDTASSTNHHSNDNYPSNDPQLSMTFQILHVTGTEKAKQFYLKLKLHGHNSIPFATFDSSPIAIISKPSKKTVKARNISTCIFDGSSVSLFSRINSQTVRTRYLDTEDGRLCAKNSSWSAFTIEIVRDGITPIIPSYAGMASAASAAAARLGVIPITYGSRIVLTDKATGTSTGPLIIRKVERGQIVAEAHGPVSQMQKVALENVTNGSGSATTIQPTYLCAGYDANVVATTTDLTDTTTATTDSQPPKTEIKSSPFLTFNRPRIITETSTECIDDHLCWTIVGLAKFQYTFCEQTGLTEQPVSPCPEIAGELTINLELSQPRLYIPIRHWYAHVRHQLQPAREVWLGNLGPLPARVVHPSHYSFTHRQETSTDITLVEIILPDPSLLLMEKKKEGGGHASSNIATTVTSIHHVNRCSINAAQWRYLSAPLYLVRADDVIYQLTAQSNDIHIYQDDEQLICRVISSTMNDEKITTTSSSNMAYFNSSSSTSMARHKSPSSSSSLPLASNDSNQSNNYRGIKRPLLPGTSIIR
ncbi:hypothetical protein BDF22DRAFT_740676 [Syncephalis plumigaleata]|nr:hypothetical protein BDF22DRAFT_740676 [Syncephalis plumigaleata]